MAILYVGIDLAKSVFAVHVSPYRMAGNSGRNDVSVWASHLELGQ